MGILGYHMHGCTEHESHRGEFMIWPIIVIGIFVLLIGVVVVVISYNRKQREKLESLANSLNLELCQGSWAEQAKLVGKYRDRSLLIKNIYHSTGKSGYFTYRVTLESKSPMRRYSGINMSHQGGSPALFTKIGRVFTSGSILFDNPEFDSKVITKAPDEVEAKQLIDIEVQQEILNMGRGTTAIKDGTIYFEAYGQAQDKPAKVRESLLHLYKLEEKLLRLSPQESSSFDDRAYAGSYDEERPLPDPGDTVSAEDVEMEFLDDGKGYYTGD
jgi:hypothetical protein